MIGQACALLRYTLLARLLGPEQLGLVAMVVLASNFFEMISDTGSDRFLVQDRQGDTPDTQRLVQLVFVSRGVLTAAGLVVFAAPIAAFFGQPPLLGGLVMLALAPLIGGLMHLDVRRFQRANDFRAEGLGMLVAEILSLVVTLIAAYVTRDFAAALYGLIARSAIRVIASHLCAQRPYAIGYSKATAGRLAAFAAPLLVNGLLMFAAGQSDRLMISRLVGVEALGLYTAALLLVLYPMVGLSRVLAGFHLPMVVADPVSTRPDSPAELMAGRALLLSLAAASGFALVGPHAILLLFGERFSQPPLLIALIGVLQATRFIRGWPTTHALALGDSRIVMVNSFARLIGIPAAFAGMALIGGIGGIVVGFIIGDFAALLTGVLMLNRRRAVAWTHDLDRCAALVVGCALVVAIAAGAQYGWYPALALAPVAAFFMAWMARRERSTLALSAAMIRNLLRRTR